MLDPVSLFEFKSHIDRRTVRARKLVVTLGSRDAGHTQRIVDTHLLNTLPNHVLGHVDTDQVLDYAATRPVIAFDRDHFAGYHAPEITLHHVTDAAEQPFLLLTGPEPNLQWERLARTVDHLIDQFAIDETLLVQGVPAPAPHTRPVFVSRFAEQTDLVPINETLPMSFEMPASFTSLLAMRLGERGRRVTGLVAHIPHYLAAGDSPEGALALLEKLERQARLTLPAGRLPEAVHIMRAKVDEEVAESEEVQEMVARLEAQYDHFISGRSLTQGLDVPTADEIGEQVEDFLRGLED